MKEKVKQVMARALRLRCPKCGQGHVYGARFHINLRCSACGLPFVREQGYFVGAIYVNLLATELIIFATYLILLFTLSYVSGVVIAILVALAIIFPIAFYPFTRSLWIGIDHIIDPAK